MNSGRGEGNRGNRENVGNRAERTTGERRDNISANRQNRVENRPENRSNWQERSQNRNENWQTRVDNRNEAWNDRAKNREQARNDFSENREQRWNDIEKGREDRQDWRNENREDWQQHREEVWDYRGDRAEEIWDHTEDFYDNCFDDHWWGNCGWGYYGGHYPVNPWWWWAPATWGAITSFVAVADPEPYYVDYGSTVVYEGDTVYVDSKPVPAAEYKQSTAGLAASAPMEEPPTPAPEGQQPEWMPLGVFALAQEEKGDPVMFFQISISRDGTIGGGYTSTLTKDQRPIAGQVDKKTQAAAWRIGENRDTIFTTSLANLTQDVSPIALNFKDGRTQTWLLVRMPEPAQGDKATAIPAANRTPPPVKKTSSN